MNNKIDVEEDIKILNEFVNDYKFKHSSKNIMDKNTHLGLAQMRAIENISADRERLKKENEKLNTEIAKHVYFESLSRECSKLAKEANWTKEDTNIVMAEYRKMEAKANKYDSLVEKIKKEIEIHKDYLFNRSNTNNLALDAHFREKERYAISILQKLLDIKKEN